MHAEPKQQTRKETRGHDSDCESKTPEDSNNPNDSKTPYEVWKFCKKQSKSVEVLYRNMDGQEILTRVHFHYNPEVMQLQYKH